MKITEDMYALAKQIVSVYESEVEQVGTGAEKHKRYDL